VVVKRERIQHLRALCEKATPGPWTVGDEHDGYASGVACDGHYLIPDMFIEFKDAQFVAEARQALPEALDYITELEAMKESYLERIANQRDFLIELNNKNKALQAQIAVLEAKLLELKTDVKGWRETYREHCIDCDGTGLDPVDAGPCDVCGDPEESR
jgi:hypothetical protein